MKVSVVILTCNRKDVVSSLVKSIDNQDVKPDEIIVVDNASSDGTFELLNDNYPEIIIVRLEENIGASGRNEGIKKASGDIIITLDDDVFFADTSSVNDIKEIFNEDDEINVLNFRILDGEDGKVVSFNWFHPYKMESFAEGNFKTDYISEGAVSFRRKIFDIVGYYPEEFFISHEGPDLAYRIIDAGYNINYTGDVSVIHKCSTQHRVSWRNTYYDTRNQIWLAVRNLPILSAITHICYRLLTTFLFAVRRKQIKWYFKAVYDGFRGIPGELSYRKPISHDTIRKIRKIRKNKPGKMYKMLDFFKRTKIINEKFAR